MDMTDHYVIHHLAAAVVMTTGERYAAYMSGCVHRKSASKST